MEQRTYPPREWTLAKSFDKEGVTVRVEKQDGFKPRFSVKVGRTNPDGKFIPALPLMLEGQGKVTIRRVAATVTALLTEAEDWVHNEAQYAEDQRIDTRTEKELKQANFGKQQARVTGKTERNRQKRRGGDVPAT